MQPRINYPYNPGYIIFATPNFRTIMDFQIITSTDIHPPLATPDLATPDSTYTPSPFLTTLDIHPFATPDIHPFATPDIHPLATPDIHPFATPDIHPFATPDIHPFATPDAGMRTSGVAEALVFLNKSDTTFMTGLYCDV